MPELTLGKHAFIRLGEKMIDGNKHTCLLCQTISDEEKKHFFDTDM